MINVQDLKGAAVEGKRGRRRVNGAGGAWHRRRRGNGEGSHNVDLPVTRSMTV